MKIYGTDGIWPKINELEAKKVSEHWVWIVSDGFISKRKRHSDTFWTQGNHYFDTWQEAKDFLLERAEIECSQARRRLEQANGHLGNVKGLKPPKREPDNA